MAFEPIQPSTNPLSASNFNKNPLEGRSLNKPPSLLDDLRAQDNKKTDDKKKDGDKTGRDDLTLSVEAQQFLNAENTKNRVLNENANTNALEKAAVEFRGLTQVSRARTLTEAESTTLNQIKENFAQIGLSEKDINKIASAKLQQISLEAPPLVKQIDSGQITGEGFAKLVSLNESFNKANGFGVSTDEQQVNAPKIEKTKNEFNSLVEVTRDRQLSRDDLSNFDKLARELSTIQGFQLNVRKTVGPDGVII